MSMLYDQWNHELSKTYGLWVPDAPPSSDFSAQITRRSAGNFELVQCVCDPCSATRGGREIVSDDLEMLAIQLILSGKERFSIDESTYNLTPGDLLIWNTTRPMKFQVTEKLQKVSVLVPLARLRSWMPGSWHTLENVHSNGSTSSTLLYGFIKSIAPEFLLGNIQNGDALTEGLLATLVSTINAEVTPSIHLKEQLLCRIKHFIDSNLANPDLCPASIANANHISLRYLHNLFQIQDQTLQQYIIHQRLQRCRRELKNTSMSSRSITDIALSWGFQHPTHFSRRFKEEFGMSPNEYRHEEN